MAGLPAIPLKIRLLCGILSPVTTIIFISLAIAGSPWFSWTENWLSDIGGEPGDSSIWSARGTPSLLFNLGLVIGGVLGMVFWTGLKESLPVSKTGGEMGMKLLLADMVLFTLVGIFPFSIGLLHMLVAFVFFLLLPFVFLFLGLALYQREESRNEGVVLSGFFFASLIALVLLGAPRPWGGNAVVEMVPASCLAIFFIHFSVKYLRESEGGTRKQQQHQT